MVSRMHVGDEYKLYWALYSCNLWNNCVVGISRSWRLAAWRLAPAWTFVRGRGFLLSTMLIFYIENIFCYKIIKINLPFHFLLQVHSCVVIFQKIFIAPKVAPWNFMGTFWGWIEDWTTLWGSKLGKTVLWIFLSKLRRNC